MISRLRSNSNIFELPECRAKKGRGQPSKYSKKPGTAKSLAAEFKNLSTTYDVHLYGRIRTVVAYERLVMIKTIKRAVKVVWIYRQNQWVALFSTDTTLSVAQIIEYYGARWKIEAAFKELKHDIGSAETQTRHPNAVTNHLHFCMLATSAAWIYASRADSSFDILFPVPRKSMLNSLVEVLMRMAA